MENRKKVKSGAAKVREKCMKLQMEQAKKCQNIASFFTSSKSSSNNSSQYDIKKPTDLNSKAHSQELDSIIPRSSSAVQSTSKTNDFLNVSSQDKKNANIENIIINSIATPVVVETDSIKNTDLAFEAHSNELDNMMLISSSAVQFTSKTNDFLNVSSQDTNNANTENIIINSNATPVVINPDTAGDYFVKPNDNMKNNFFEYHPVQPHLGNVPYNPRLVFYDKNRINRQWLSFSEKKRAFFCSCCLAFSNSMEKNLFVEGMYDLSTKHIYTRIEQHETSRHHLNNVEAYMLNYNQVDIENLMFKKQLTLRKSQVQERREVLERIIETIKTIGKRGMSYRGTQSEASRSLSNTNIDHGTFLELILLISKFDPVLKSHLVHVTKDTPKSVSNECKKVGRGSFVSFLSKTTVNNLIQIIKQIMKRNIAEEVKEAEMYSIQIDTTQDIKVEDQCSIIIRYVNDSVNERLIGVSNVISSTGKSMFELVSNILMDNGIDIKYCIGSATDGASNMQGQYQGFSKFLSDASPGQIHVWCHAHLLNLVMIDATSKTMECTSFFGLLNSCAVFIKDSYKRMNIWKDIGTETNRRLVNANDTRWWSKDAAVRSIFGRFGSPGGNQNDEGLYGILVTTLKQISSSHSIKTDIKFNARSLMKHLLSYKTVITAQLYLRLFEHTTPLSKYLQTNGMDILQAQRMVNTTIKDLETISRDFKEVKKAADNFLVWANQKFDELETDEVIVNSFLSKDSVRKRKRKRMFDEILEDQPFENPEEKFKISVHNHVIDTVIMTLKERFSKYESLFADFSILDPKNFQDTDQTIPHKAFERLSHLIMRFDSNATANSLRLEYFGFKSKWPKLCQTVPSDYLDYESDSDQTDNDMSDLKLNKQSCKKTCKNCILCVYLVLKKFNFHSKAYKCLYLAYKFILTLSVSQVACERSFSKLKTIKTRLRNSLSQDNLEACMMMSIEKDILIKVNNEEVKNLLGSSNVTMSKLLLL